LQKKAHEMIASGRLGQVTKVVASYNRNSSTGAWKYPIPPELRDGVNFNWKEWRGSAPERPFDGGERVFRYRKYWDYSGGIATDLFVHLITSIRYIMDVKMPKSVAAMGGILRWKDGREVPDTLDAMFEYDGFCINMGSSFNNASGPGEAIQFLATEGSLVLGQTALSLMPERRHEGYQYAIESGKAKARTGLRMMPTFPLPPLKFCTAGFPRYGFKAGLSDEAFPANRFAIVLRALGCHRYSLLCVRDDALASTASGSTALPQGPSLRSGLFCPGPSSLIRPHPPHSRAHPDFTVWRLIRDAFAVPIRIGRGDPRRVLSFHRCSFTTCRPL
jgi:predicted dehydrogenase